MSTATAKQLRTAEVAEERPDEEVIAGWLTDYIAKTLKLDRDKVRLDATFDSFGLDSAATVGLTGDLGDWLRISVDPSLAYDHPTIRALAAHLAAEVRSDA